MTKIILNGKSMTSKERAHHYLRLKLNSDEYYGDNLDALWDVLSTYSEGVEISFIHSDRLIDHLGDYGEAIIKVFQDAEKENEQISFEMI